MFQKNGPSKSLGFWHVFHVKKGFFNSLLGEDALYDDVVPGDDPYHHFRARC